MRHSMRTTITGAIAVSVLLLLGACQTPMPVETPPAEEPQVIDTPAPKPEPKLPPPANPQYEDYAELPPPLKAPGRR